MRSCTACGKELTAQATFCTNCGAEAPVAAPPPPPPPANNSPRFCGSCGAELAPGAKFCGSCGSSTGAAAIAAAAPSPAPAYAPPPPSPFAGSEPTDQPNRTPLIIGGVAVAALLLALLFWVNRYEWLGMERPAEVGNSTMAVGEEAEMYVIANANMRDRPTSQGSNVTGKLVRGAKVKGVIQLGEDGSSNWLKIADSSNYVSAVNLSANAPPALARFINKPWFAGDATPILVKPEAGAAVLETAQSGKQYQVIGLTAGGFAEVLLTKGGVGYFDASGIDLDAGSAPPIDLAFNPADCGFGKEGDALLRKLSLQSQSRYQAIEAKTYPDDEARQAALDAAEGQSAFLPLNRSWNGLRVGGLGAHYESSSIYFKEPAARVIEVLSKTYRLDGDGVFITNSDSAVSASISATSGDGRKYGQSEISCGV